MFNFHVEIDTKLSINQFSRFSLCASNILYVNVCICINISVDYHLFLAKIIFHSIVLFNLQFKKIKQKSTAFHHLTNHWIIYYDVLYTFDATATRYSPSTQPPLPYTKKKKKLEFSNYVFNVHLLAVKIHHFFSQLQLFWPSF